MLTVQDVRGRIGLVLGVMLFALPLSSMANDDEWVFSVTPYLWAPAQEGTAATLPGLPAADVDIEFSDIWDNLDVGFMGRFVAKKGQMGLFLDMTYMDVSTRAHGAKSDRGLIIDYEQQLGLVDAGGSFEVSQSNEHSVDVMAGVRYWYLDNELKLKFIPGTVKVSHEEDWVDLFVGVQGEQKISQKWSVIGRANVSLAGDSDSFWEALVGFGYQVDDSVALKVAYKHLEVDYSEGEFIYDMDFYGPAFGATFTF